MFANQREAHPAWHAKIKASPSLTVEGLSCTAGTLVPMLHGQTGHLGSAVEAVEA